MRAWLIVLFLTLIFRPAFASDSLPIDIVFDIDWTTFYSIDTQDPLQQDKKNIVIEGKTYRPTDYLAEVIESLLLRHPEIRISFFSGGEKSRNEALLNQVVLSDGRTLKDIAHRILSKEHLTSVSQDETKSFSQRYKKGLAHEIPDWSPRRAILIDDQPEFALRPLKAVPSLGIFNFLNSFDSARASSNYHPSSEQAWHQERNKALLWLGMIEISLAEAKKSGRDFSVIAQETWQKHSQDSLMMSRGKNYLTPAAGLSCQKVFSF